VPWSLVCIMDQDRVVQAPASTARTSSLSHTLSTPLYLPPSLTHTLFGSHTISLSHTITHSDALTHSRRYPVRGVPGTGSDRALSLARELSLSHTHSLSLYLSLPHTHTHTPTLSRSHAHSRRDPVRGVPGAGSDRLLYQHHHWQPHGGESESVCVSVCE